MSTLVRYPLSEDLVGRKGGEEGRGRGRKAVVVSQGVWVTDFMQQWLGTHM